MIRILKYISYIVLFFTLILVFLPKEKLVNKVLIELKNNKISVSKYEFTDKLFMFDISDIDIYYDGIQASNIQQVYIKPYLLVNDIIIKNIKLDDSLATFVPSSIELIKIKYSILDPLNIKINAYSKLYKIDGKFDILNKNLKLNINLSKRFKNKYPKILRKLKYDKTTKDYTYEYQL